MREKIIEVVSEQGVQIAVATHRQSLLWKFPVHGGTAILQRTPEGRLVIKTVLRPGMETE
jgi:hypothetical protein